MIRNNFLLVLLTFNFSPLLFSPIINTENVLSTGSLVGSKSWLFYKGSCSTFIKRNELTLPKAFKSKALTPFVRIWTLTHVHTSSIIIFQLYVIPISISKSTCRASEFASIDNSQEQQLRKNYHVPLPSPRTRSKIFLSVLASVKASVSSNPERETGLTHSVASFLGQEKRNVTGEMWNGAYLSGIERNTNNSDSYQSHIRCCVRPQLS